MVTAQEIDELTTTFKGRYPSLERDNLSSGMAFIAEILEAQGITSTKSRVASEAKAAINQIQES